MDVVPLSAAPATGSAVAAAAALAAAGVERGGQFAVDAVHHFGKLFPRTLQRHVHGLLFDFFLHRRKDDFYVNLTYNTLAYSNAFVARFLNNYTAAIHGLAAGKTLGEIVKEILRG